jgi:hypothetical protein
MAGATPRNAAGPVLTVGGLVMAPNRSAYKAERDGFFKHHNLEFASAYAFSADSLASLPLRHVKATTKQIGRAEFSGPSLPDVIAAATVSLQTTTLRLVALDGFAVDLPMKEARDGEWILATSANGAAFSIGDFAPVWLIRNHEGENVPPDEEEQKWVWSVFYIEAS